MLQTRRLSLFHEQHMISTKTPWVLESLTLVQVGDWRKYALEAIIKLLFISLYHDKNLLFMLELY